VSPNYKPNVLQLDENITALWVWLNSGKPDDLLTNALSTDTKCRSHRINILWNCWSPLSRHHKKWGKCIFYL